MGLLECNLFVFEGFEDFEDFWMGLFSKKNNFILKVIFSFLQINTDKL